ncbi:hypothetical protein PHYC_02192 [Phycisphaerales bacterium]|nr:hypothetical protein PHYC_02192 [Phycisphaerales bacterium]
MSGGRSKLGDTVLDTLRQHMKLAIKVDSSSPLGGPTLWRLHAQSVGGQVWVAEHEDYYKAACILAEMVGFELEDG